MQLSVEHVWFTKQLTILADPTRAKGEKRYLKSPLEHYGVTVPALRKLAKIWLMEHRNFTLPQIIPVCEKLWQGESHEERMLAIFLLVYQVDELTYHDLPIIEHMVRTATGWAQLDMIAAWLCGRLFEDDSTRMTIVMRRWIKDDNFWVQRAALLTLLGPVRKDPSNFLLFTELATPLLPEKEFFIRKAIGWVLRELAKLQPELVYDYVKEHHHAMSGLTYREATRKLPPTMQAKLKTS